MTYFELLEIEQSFEIDLSAANKNYKIKQRKFHPDFNINSSEADKDEMLHLSSQLNQAWEVLKNDEKRIEYILKINSIIIEDEKYNLDNLFLMQMMDINELLETNLDEAKLEIEEIQTRLDLEFKNISQKKIDTLTKEDWQLLKKIYFQKKYLDRLIKQSI